MSDIWAPQTHAGAPVPWAWLLLLRFHGVATRQIDARLQAAHGLTLADYEVLLHLSWAPEGRARPVDLAEGALLTQGGITRLLDGLERDGLVERTRSKQDRRVFYAQLTARGRARFEEAAHTHVQDVHTLFTDHFTEAELGTLTDLLARLPSGQQVAPSGKRAADDPAGRTST